MARVDIPTLQCDRCKLTTQDYDIMSGFRDVQWYEGDSGNRRFKKDLCLTCWGHFQQFLSNLPVERLQ